MTARDGSVLRPSIDIFDGMSYTQGDTATSAATIRSPAHAFPESKTTVADAVQRLRLIDNELKMALATLEPLVQGSQAFGASKASGRPQ